MRASTLTSKSQITVPKAVRESLRLGPGDRLRFVIHDNGTVSVEAETVDLRSLRGAIKRGRHRVSLEQMQHAIRLGGAAATTP